ncbi:antibiotic biosynthesis monooxygenase [Sphingomonas sp. RB3P16]|uniref:putative quinol monooxygenase n=1 Tax=Parasphingomonas frigoris TaxID=3096163 RepID=UPI002FCC0A38
MVDANATPAFLIVANYVLDPADAEAFQRIAARMAEQAKRRPGNVFLNAARDVADPNIFHLTEGWASQEALDEHFRSDAFQAVLSEALALRIVARSGSIFFISGAQALDMPS